MGFVAEYIPPPLTCTGYIAMAPDVIAANSISVPPGVWLAVIASRADRTMAGLMTIGPTHNYINAGQSYPTLAFSQKAMIDSCDNMLNLMVGAGGDFRTATEAQCRNAANAINPGNKAQFYMTEEGEKLNIITAQDPSDNRDYGAGAGNGVPITVWNASNQCYWFNNQLALNVRAAGGEHYRGYDGFLNLTNAIFQSMSDFRAMLSSDQSAYEIGKQYSGLGNPYLIGDAGAWSGGAIKAYFTGDDNRKRFFAAKVGEMIVGVRARRHKGWTGRIASIYWNGYDERVGSPPYSGQLYSRPTPSGGTVSRPAPPLMAVDVQVALNCLSMLFGLDVFDWTENERFGSNPAVSFPDVANGGPDGTVVWSGNVGDFALSTYADNTGNVGHPPNPKGGKDIAIVATHLSHWLRAHAASTPAYLSLSINGGAFCATEDDYIADQFEGQGVFGFMLSQGSNRSVLIVDMNDTGPTRTVAINYGGATAHTFESQGQFYYAARLTTV